MNKSLWHFIWLILVATFIIPLVYSTPRAPDPIRRKVTGQVLDSKTQKPIYRAETIFYSNNKSVLRASLTDGNGNFLMANVPVGTYDVKIAHKYYLNKWYRNIRIPDTGTISLKKIWIIARPNYEELIQKDSIEKSIRLKERQKLPTGVPLIAGRVLEKYSLEPIIGARIRLLLPDGTSTKRGELTNPNGDFIILNIPAGTYQVEISYGHVYVKQRFTGVRVQNNLATDLGIILLREASIMPDTV